jgi:hypothetical protein
MKFLDYCELHRILVAVYPPHSTHRLQPLDVSLFNPLANFYSQELNKWIHKTQGLCRFTKREFFRLFWPAFTRAFSTKNIASGWKRTGLYPLDPNIVLSQIQRKQVLPPPRPLTSSSSTSSALLDADWRKVRQLLKLAVGEVLGKDVRKLANTIDKLATDNSILKHENDGLR